MNPRTLLPLILLALQGVALADGPADNLPDKVRRVPPPGLAIPANDRTELEEGTAQLGRDIEGLRTSLTNKPALLALLPDVQIFHNAVRYALTYDEFFKTNEVKVAQNLLKLGQERAQQLRSNQAPWITATGLVVRGYVSRIDGSVQPYGLEVPPSFVAGGLAHRLDLWFHGRGETLSELDFLNGRLKSPGEFVPAAAFVLHLYGRYCNGDKFAGEIDAFEAMDAVKKAYPIDENRIVVRGFSLGGAAAWHMAVHHAGLWAAAAPGAGFSETADFLKVFQNEPVKPTWYEQKLWHMYDCPDYAINLFNCPVVAYSGEIDKQKQAADIMAKALAAEGIELTHIIGPKTGHSYHPDSKKEINRRLDSIVDRGRNPVPDTVRFATWTLRYNSMLWVKIDGMGEHWEKSTVDARIENPAMVRITTTNVTALSLIMPPGYSPLDVTRKPTVIINGQQLTAPGVMSDRSWKAQFRFDNGKWAVAHTISAGLRKVHGLQGPIDDAFMDSFLMVKPTGQSQNEKVGAWVAAEQTHALEHWRRQFRGEARVINDEAVSDADIANHNLVLWGDPTSNKLLARIAAQLPIQWNNQSVVVGKDKFPAANHVPVMIFPNPLNPKKYVVLNSGFTFREYDYLNNARQISKLPDFAVVDISVPVTPRLPGGIVKAGFFGEHWELPKAQ